MWHSLLSAETAVLDQIVNVGAVGAILVLFALGLIVPVTVYKRESERADRAERQRDEFTKDVVERVVPILERTIVATNERASIDGQILELLTDIRRLRERQ